MAADLTAYVPQLLLEWESRFGATMHRSIEGTLVFADVSGFTALSEKLHRIGGKLGAEQMADIISELFSELLGLASRRGGEMLKYGGDAILVFFEGDGHAPRAAAAALEMQRRLRSIGRVDSGSGFVRLRMSVGMHSGAFDFFVVGRRHHELVVAGPATTKTVEVEAAASATEILLSAECAARIDERCLGDEKEGGRLLMRMPRAASVDATSRRLLRPTVTPTSFLSRLVAAHLVEDDEPDHRLAAVAFLHLVGLDALLEAGLAEGAAQQLDDTLTVIQDAFDDFGVAFLATDLYHDGTKVMAAAGAPVAHADPEERMLRAIRKILESDPPLAIRAGVNRGHVFAGAVGPSFRRTYTAMGDVTNTAARVMARAAPGELLALAPVLDAAGSIYEVEALEPFMAKGKTDLLVPWRVGRVVGRRTALGESLPLVGRESEWAALSGALTSVKAGAGPQVVQITADAGMGKSRLLDELRGAAASAGAPMVSVACDPYTMQEPYAAAKPMLSALVGGDDAAALTAAVAESAPELIPWLPLLAIPLGAEVSTTPEVDALDPANRRNRLHGAIAELTIALVHTPTLAIIEDSHWADEASASVFDFLASNLGTTPLLLCATRRPDDTGLRLTSPDFDMRLEPLAAEAAKLLVRRALPGGILGAELEELAAKAEGNPLFLRELALASLGTLREVPNSVEGLIAARIDALPTADRRLLRVAAVVGTSFDESLVDAATEGDDNPESSFDNLMTFVERDPTAGDGAWRFSHALVRDVAYEGLPYRRRRDFHHRVGLAVEARIVDPEDACELLSLHFGQTGDQARVAKYSTLAGERARARFAYSQAAEFFERAAIASSSNAGALLLKSGEARLDSGDSRAALGALRRARRQILPGTPDRMRSALVQARCLVALGSLAGADRFASKALIELEAGGTVGPEAVRIRLVQAISSLYRGQTAKAHRLATSAADLAERLGDLAGTGHAAQLMSLSLPDDQSDRRRELGRRALEIFEEIGDATEAANARNTLGIEAQYAGRWPEAAELFERASGDAERVGSRLAAASLTNNLGEIFLSQGRYIEAIEALGSAAAAGRRLGAGWWPVVVSNEACARARGGDPGSVTAALVECVGALDQLGWQDEACRARLRLSEAELLGVGPGPFTAKLDQTHKGCELHPMRDRLLGWRAIMVGDIAGAIDMLRRAASPAGQLRVTEEPAIARSTLMALTAEGIDLAEHRADLERLGIVAVPTLPLLAGTAIDHVTW